MIKCTWKAAVKRGLGLPLYRALGYIPPTATVLDIGCGNHSPQQIKHLFPELYYIGVDVEEYNIDEADKIAANEFHFVGRDSFISDLRDQLNQQADLIIVSHVLEHAYEPYHLLEYLSTLLKVRGYMYLAFPAEESVAFPSRPGTLNFFDDPSHRWLPPFIEVLNRCMRLGLRPIFVRKRYRHPVLCILGAIEHVLGPIWKVLVGRRSSFFAWHLFGFESIIIVQKIN